MNLGAADLDRLALSTGFLPDTLEKVIRLGEVVDSIARHAFLSRVLALKSGTALNLFFGPPHRLSVDLDFNYLGRTPSSGVDTSAASLADAEERGSRSGLVLLAKVIAVLRLNRSDVAIPLNRDAFVAAYVMA